MPEDKHDLITCIGAPLPIAPCLDDSAIRAAIDDLPRTDLSEGIRETMRQFEILRDADKLDTGDLEN